LKQQTSKIRTTYLLHSDWH